MAACSRSSVAKVKYPVESKRALVKINWNEKGELWFYNESHLEKDDYTFILASDFYLDETSDWKYR